jgi:hypothetical protein
VVTAVPVGAAAVVSTAVVPAVPAAPMVASTVIIAAAVIIAPTAVPAAAVKPWRHDAAAAAPRHAASVDVTVKSGSASARGQRYARITPVGGRGRHRVR